jgi:16S rRNA (cytidine1402-2'-O)-methyltransferase
MSLVLVPTPIGNLRDITLRALDVLRSCQLIVAEDTRTTKRLLSAHEISGKELWSYREQNAARVTRAILARAAEQVVAVVADAGMPGISDPGRGLVVAARSEGIAVEILPGPSAFVCAAVLSGFDLDGFSFEGFVPRRTAERRAAFEAALARARTSAWYEAPHRIGQTLHDLAELRPEADVFLVRELTKLHEQQLTGTPAAVRAALPEPVRGEIVLVLGACASSEARKCTDCDLDAEIDAALDAGLDATSATKAVASRLGLQRRDVYLRVSRRKRQREPGGLN